MTNDPANPRNNDLHMPSELTLRDYFAAKALVGLINNDSGCRSWVGADTYETAATKTAYIIADAMLKQREVK